MTLTDRPTQIALGNNIDIRFEDTRVRGVIDEGLTLRGFVSLTRNGGPLSGGVTAAAVAVGDGSGDYNATILGTAVTAALAAYLHTTVWIVGESVPAGSYREAFPVRVVQDQGGG